MKMQRRISFFAFLLCTIGANGSAWAEYFNFYALATHPCVVRDCGGNALNFSHYNDASHGYYYVHNYDIGATDLLVDEAGDYSQIIADEPQGLRFKGWYTKSGAWAFDAQPEVSLATVCLETGRTISGAKIKNAALWGNGVESARPTIVAKYVPIYGVNASASPADAGTVSDSRIYEEGERVSLSSSAKDGYALKGWEKDGQFVSPTNFSFVAAAGCAGTYTAVFTGKVYRVDLLIQGGEGGTDIVMATYRQPMPTPIVLPHRYGYDFGGYFDQTGGAGVQYYSAEGESAHLWDKSFGGTLNAFWIPQKRPLNIRLEPGVAKVCYRFGQDLTWNETTTNATIDVVVGTVVHGYGVATEGWEITKWRIYDDEQYEKTMGTNGLELKPEAQKETVRWTVTFADPTWTYKSEQEVVEDGGAVTPPDWTRVGYELSWNPAGFEKVTANFTANAVWTPITSIVRFDANGGSGAMADQTAVYDQPLTLRANEFVNAPLFFAHWTTSVDKVEYPDGAVVSNLTTVADATNVFYAVWEKHTFTVRFFGNGGTNTMAEQSFDYGSGTSLRPNAFVRDGFSFVGWATDPTNAVACADQDDASTLTTVDGAIVPLYAKWKANGSGIDSELSAAIGCDSVNLTTNNFGWVIAPGEGEGGKAALRTNAGVFEWNSSHALSATLVGKGVLTFRYKTSIVEASRLEYGGEPSVFSFKVGDTMKISETSDSNWTEHSYEKASEEVETVSWKIVMANHNHPDDVSWGPCGSDDDYALIDFVRWEPAVTNAMTVGVTFRDADGGVFSNATYVAGEAIGALPTLKNGEGVDCAWTYGGSAVDAGWIVPAAAAGVELLPSWGDVPPEHPVPEAKDAVTISSAAVADGAFTLSFKSDARFDYNLITNANLLIDSWGVMATEKGTGETVFFDPPVIDELPQLFYKVETIQKRD